jgi:uncharacterized DUF497 family protein
MSSSPYIEDFAFDEENEEEMAKHGISPEQLLQVLDGPYRVRKNRHQRRASHLILGRDRQSQCIAIPVEPTHVREIWRPVTAWFCKPHEWGWLPPED